MSPEDRYKSMVMMLNIELFPAPFGPSNPRTSPLATQKVFPLTAATPSEYTLTRSFAFTSC